MPAMTEIDPARLLRTLEDDEASQQEARRKCAEELRRWCKRHRFVLLGDPPVWNGYGLHEDDVLALADSWSSTPGRDGDGEG